MHLKKDLDGDPVDWRDCGDPSDPPSPLLLTSYGIRRDLQRRLAAIRTDLDAFNDIEASSLMASGYRMTPTRVEAGVRFRIRYRRALRTLEVSCCRRRLADARPRP